MDWLGDPLDVGVLADNVVVWVDQDHFEVFEDRIFGDPVGVQNAETTALTANTFFGNGLKVAGKFEFVDTMGLWLTISLTLADLALAATSADTDAVDNVS